MANSKNLIGKGFDARPENINRKGAPRVLPELKEILTNILSEEITDNKTGNKYTQLEAVLRVLQSKAVKGDLRAIQEVLDRFYGKSNQAKDDNESDKEIKITVEHVRNPSKP